MALIRTGGRASFPNTLKFYSLGGASGNGKIMTIDYTLVKEYNNIKVTCSPSGTVTIGYVTSSMSDTPTSLGTITLNTDTALSTFNIPSNAVGLTIQPDISIAYPAYTVELSM